MKPWEERISSERISFLGPPVLFLSHIPMPRVLILMPPPTSAVWVTIYSRRPPGGTDSSLTFINLWGIHTLETAFSLSSPFSGSLAYEGKHVLTSKRQQSAWAPDKGLLL